MEFNRQIMDHNEQMWQDFAQSEHISAHQLEQFKQYAALLIEWNERMNLTAITDLQDVVAYHFKDSIALGHAVDLTTSTAIADVGSGAGFPAIPLKIRYPHLRVVMIEVLAKRRQFLQEAITALGLTDCVIEERDWRTFLRATKEPVSIICARASLHTDELVRMFKQNCFYRTAQLAYWASANWQPTEKDEPYLKENWPYTVGDRARKLVFFRQ